MGSSSCGGIVVVVPCYEPSASVFLPYVKELLNEKIKRLIVVDDGSGSEYAGVFASLSALENVTVISYGKNQGKGYALKRAFSYCKQLLPRKTFSLRLIAMDNISSAMY